MSKKKELQTLKRAQKILQRTHDYYETVGFNINTYINGNHRESYDWSKKPDIGPICYIGGIRLSAGVYPSPIQGTDVGDGPELRVALEIVDRVARKKLARINPDALREATRRANDWDQPGRLAEEFGFTVNSYSDERQRTKAITLMRQALREVHKKIEALEG
jgi:hypothetical protein